MTSPRHPDSASAGDTGPLHLWERRADAEIESDLQSALKGRSDAEDIDLRVMDGVVNLTGQLRERTDTEVVRRKAISIMGVRRVNDWLTSQDEGAGPDA